MCCLDNLLSVCELLGVGFGCLFVVVVLLCVCSLLFWLFWFVCWLIGCLCLVGCLCFGVVCTDLL